MPILLHRSGACAWGGERERRGTRWPCGASSSRRDEQHVPVERARVGVLGGCRHGHPWMWKLFLHIERGDGGDHPATESGVCGATVGFVRALTLRGPVPMRQDRLTRPVPVRSSNAGAAGPARRDACPHRRGRRPHRAAAQRNPDPRAAPAVRQRVAVRAHRDQPLRRPRPGLVLERHPDLRAHRHPFRRARALGDGEGRRRRRRGAAGAAGRPGRGARLLDAGRGRPRLPAGGGARAGLGGRARAASRAAAGCSTAPAGTRAARTRAPSSTRTRPARTPPASRWTVRGGWPRRRR